MAKIQKPGTVAADSTADKTTDTKTKKPAWDAAPVASAIIAAITTDKADAAAVAAILKADASTEARRNAVLTAVMLGGADASTAGVLTDAMKIAAVPAEKKARTVVPPDHDAVFAAFAACLTAYATIHGFSPDRGPVAAFLSAATKVPHDATTEANDNAAAVVRSVVKKGGPRGGTGTRATVEGRDASKVAALPADSLSYRDHTATVSIGEDGRLSIRVRDAAKKIVGTVNNMTAAAKLANGGTSVNGWEDAWVTKDGRTAHAVAIGIAAQ